MNSSLCGSLNYAESRDSKQIIHLHDVLGPVHRYPDIFENTYFLLRILKNLHPHVAYSNRIRPLARIQQVSGFTVVPSNPL